MVEEPDKILDELAYSVIGASIEVHCQLGPGYLESVYEEALCVELAGRHIQFERQKQFDVLYRGTKVGGGRIVILVEKILVIETKAVSELNDVFMAQILSYLKANSLQLGLLINFNVKLLRDGIRRVILS